MAPRQWFHEGDEKTVNFASQAARDWANPEFGEARFRSTLVCSANRTCSFGYRESARGATVRRPLYGLTVPN